MAIVIKCPNTGESIEEMLRRVTETKEPIENVAPMIYTERKDGVRPEYDIRTDRFEIAIDAMDKFSKSGNAHRDEGVDVTETQDTQQQQQQQQEPTKTE